MDFTSRQLRAFHLVAQHRNFRRAAEALFITRSGLSVLIRELERQIGFRVFERTTRQVSLTPQGQELLAVTQPALGAVEMGVARIDQSIKKRNRQISFGITPWLAAHMLPRAMKEFYSLHPEVQITIFDGNPSTLVQLVESSKVDFAVGIFDRIIGIRRVPFFQFPLMLAEADDERAIRYGSDKWSAIKDKNLISLSKDFAYEEQVRQQLAKMEIKFKRVQVVNMLDTQIGLVEAGIGVAVIPSFALFISQNRQVRLTKLDPTINVEFYEITKRGRALPPEAVEFGAFLKTHIARRLSQ